MTFENEEKYGEVIVQKRTEGMLNIEGIEFILSGTSDSGRAIELKATTNENGIANFTGVPIGTYVVKENGETVPTAYLTADEKSVTVEYAKTANVPFTNTEKTGTVQVTKATVGSLNLESIEFILSGTSDSGRSIEVKATTDENGIANFTGVPIGTYVVKENGDTVPTAYLTASEQTVKVEYAKTTPVTFENKEKTGSIQVTKATVGSLNLEGIEFILSGTSDSGRAIELKATTNENGIANFTGVPIGTYVVKENGDTVPTAYLIVVRFSGYIFIIGAIAFSHL